MNWEDRINEELSRDAHRLPEIDRRDFFRKMGGGLFIALSVGHLKLLAGTPPDEEPGINAFLRIGEDGRVTLYSGNIEMGQGAITSLPMMLADELDVKLDDVDMIMGDTEICPWDPYTAGSTTTRIDGQTLRAAAAKAKMILVGMAAEKLSAGPEQLEVSDGIISVKGNPGKKVSYAELTMGKEILDTLEGKPELKKAAEMKVMGTSRMHVDARLKVTGEAKYSGDIQLPGMMYAKIVRPPSLGATLISADTSRAEAIEGVEIVRDGDFIVILHESQDIADVAIAKVKSEWQEEQSELDHKNIYEHLEKSSTESRKMNSGGDVKTGAENSEQIFKSEFRDPYLAHAPIENHTATCVFEGDKLNVWASSQAPFPHSERIANDLGMPKEKVRYLEIFTGGGFGGKLSNQQADEAARIAKLSGKPIQLVYSRQEEFLFDRLRHAAFIRLESGINADGNMEMWDYNLYFGGRRGAVHFYDIPHHRTLSHGAPRGTRVHPLYTGPWRGPSNNTNTFARESQIEIMAAATGRDALQFRLDHLKENPKMARVLKEGAEKFGWETADGPGSRKQVKGDLKRGFGIAAGIDAGTYVAIFAEVEVNTKTGHIQVLRTVVSQDMGLVVNRQGAIIQAEGSVIMGLGYTLSEEIEFEGSKMLSRNFDTYNIPRISWTPKIDVVLVDKQDEPPQGGGEPAIIAIGGAVANAVYDATGARIYQFPLTKERILEAISSSRES